MAYGLCWPLTGDQKLLGWFAAGAAVLTLFIKLKGLGRYGGILFYSLPLIVASYWCYDRDVFALDADNVNITLVYCLWGGALLIGVIIGLSEELERRDR